MTEIPRERWNDLIDFLSSGPFFDVVPVLEEMRIEAPEIQEIRDELAEAHRQIDELEYKNDYEDLLDEIEQLILSRHNR